MESGLTARSILALVGYSSHATPPCASPHPSRCCARSSRTLPPSAWNACHPSRTTTCITPSRSNAQYTAGTIVFIEAITPQETSATVITMYVQCFLLDHLCNLLSWTQTTGNIETNESTYFCPKGSLDFSATCLGCH
ncbi:hypothetical protein DFH29DRAFT_370272 [Suillus ampliporus]|nr:hypothetical protein DFH29DRAFT_370272 [Suillus ampliporus]